MFEFVDRVVPTFQTPPSQLQQHSAGRRVDEIVAQRDLHDGARAFRDRDEARRIGALQLVQTDPVDRDDLMGCRARFQPPAARRKVARILRSGSG